MKKLMKHVMIIGLVMMIGFNTLMSNAKAASTFTINGVSVQYYDFSSAPQQCWTYANNMYRKIWGVTVTYSKSNQDNFLAGLSAEELRLTEENLKKYIENTTLGSVIRVTDYNGLYSSGDFVGHSQVIVQKDENGFTVLEGGLSTAPYKREHYYTWDEYCNRSWLSRYGYIKYIVWPQAVPYQQIDQEKKQALLQNIEVLTPKTNEVIDNVMRANNVIDAITPVPTAANSKTGTIEAIG